MLSPGAVVPTLSYDEALRFWFGRVNYERRSPKPSDLTLDRMRALLYLLGEPHRRLRIVHVAGSKGKGSTSAMLAAVLERAGYRTGLFTSPHLERVEERIQVSGASITASELAQHMSEVRRAVETLDAQAGDAAPVTFFEVATALGFLHLVRRRVDVAVLEVGLGGRFDSTNVCTPLVSIVTSISFDHTQQLGDTLAKIAAEKAGIIKPGRPALSGVRDAEARAVIEAAARERRAPLRQLDVNFRYAYEPGRFDNGCAHPSRVQVTTERREWPAFDMELVGDHQAANAALVVAAVEELRRQGLYIPDVAVAAGLAHVHWPARLEAVGHAPLVLLDCAHNVASAQALLDTLQASFPLQASGRRILIFASSRDKDVAGMLALLAPHFAHVIVTRFADNPRAVPPEQLAETLTHAGHKDHTVCATAIEAWDEARRRARPADQICITGSVFLAGELRPTIRSSQTPSVPTTS